MGLVTRVRGVRERHPRLSPRSGLRRGPLLDIAKVRSHAEKAIADYDIRPPNPRLKTANFSGGNQQKIVLAREIERDPIGLLVGQPTAASTSAHRVHSQAPVALRDSGKGIPSVSVELDEVRALADRVVVMCGEPSWRAAADVQRAGARPLSWPACERQPDVEPIAALVEYALIPLLNLTAAFLVSGPRGAVESARTAQRRAIPRLRRARLRRGHRLHPVSTPPTSSSRARLRVAYQAGLFSIGAEGQPISAASALPSSASRSGGWSWWAALRSCSSRGGLRRRLGGDPGLSPGKRGSHIVITTIMFNFIASA